MLKSKKQMSPSEKKDVLYQHEKEVNGGEGKLPVAERKTNARMVAIFDEGFRTGKMLEERREGERDRDREGRRWYKSSQKPRCLSRFGEQGRTEVSERSYTRRVFEGDEAVSPCMKARKRR